ncbi:hypothetical protein Moror_6325 [Moniliophthora roreri MCA 2997]|uniref:DUF1746 domain-containing protein n=1 Tax=Moniliophthora roreri (strain MCA 2997) TaxID=1381753 RepID=V2YZG7_MONRO|nr:hypothetical protein Moror_6325 [Moniliophthora roreri MCA 2997]
MQKRFHAQRQHIINSLDSVLHQLHCLSFLQSSSIFHLLLRIFSQVVCRTPREIVSNSPLGVFFVMVLLFNAPCIWAHALYGASEGRAIILDFIGLGYVPTKLQLLSLDFFILFLQMLLATASYEIHTSSPGTSDDTSSDEPRPSTAWTSWDENPSLEASFSDAKPDNSVNYVLDIHLSSTLARLRRAPPIPRPSDQNNLLPLPNTTTWPVHAGVSLLMTPGSARFVVGEAPSQRTVPGALDSNE